MWYLRKGCKGYSRYPIAIIVESSVTACSLTASCYGKENAYANANKENLTTPNMQCKCAEPSTAPCVQISNFQDAEAFMSSANMLSRCGIVSVCSNDHQTSPSSLKVLHTSLIINLQWRNLIHVIQPASPTLLFLQPIIRPQHQMPLHKIHQYLRVRFA
jgi:hypothetical protein